VSLGTLSKVLEQSDDLTTRDANSKGFTVYSEWKLFMTLTKLLLT